MRYRSVLASPFLLLTFLVALVVPPASAQRGALTAPRSLAQLTGEAQRIVHGYVLSARVEPHPQFKNLDTLVIRMSVTETLKGAPQSTLEFRQFIWDPRDKLDAARYAKGQELLLMLGPVSQYGLTSPVGLEQGRFRILRDRQGNVLALNGRGNAGLFAGVETQARARGMKLSPRATALVRRTQPGPVPLADLEDAVRTLAGGAQ